MILEGACLNPKDGRLCGQRIDLQARRCGVALLGFVRLRLGSVERRENWWSRIRWDCASLSFLWTGQAQTGETRVRGFEEGMLLAAVRGAEHRNEQKRVAARPAGRPCGGWDALQYCVCL